MASLAIHLGPGPLGLGLIVDTLLDTGFDVCLIGRPEAPIVERLEYWLAFANPELGLQLRQVQWAANPRNLADLDDDVITRLASPEPVLITAALGTEGAAQREPLLFEILASRPPDTETILLACENEPHPMYARVAKAFPGVHYCACVVDRVCSANEPERDSEGRRRLLAHPVAQWVVRDQPGGEGVLLPRLGASSHVLLLSRGLAAYKARKFWVVNGVHLVLALLARLTGVDELPLDAAREAAFRQIATPVIGVLLDCVARQWPELPADQGFAAQRIAAFCESPDSASRILRKRLVRADLRPLMARLDTRLGEPARLAHDHGLDCRCFLGISELIINTLADRDAYLKDDGAGIPTEAIDAEVVEMFERFTDGWMDSGQSSKAAFRLRRVLAAQRE